jgi:hypothetical protein
LSTINLNSFPYYSDFDATKQYLMGLFKPGFSVQAREISVIQQILQNQISSFAQNIFQNGSMVIPGASALNLNLPFLTLQPTYNSLPMVVANFSNQAIVGLTSGTIANVLTYIAADGTDPDTLYLKIQTGASTQSTTASINVGSNIVNSSSLDTSAITVGALVSGTGIPVGTFITQILSSSSFSISNFATALNPTASLTITTGSAFVNNETIATVVPSPSPIIFAQTSLTNSTGFGSSATLKQGIFFVNGFFCFVTGDQPDGSQLLILDKYTNTPSYRIGLAIEDSIVTSATDPTLNDPANGFSNYNAPGADRYRIDLILSKIALNVTTSENFIQLIEVENGVLQSIVTNPQYAEIEKSMARRTFDTNGDFTVKYFKMNVQEIPPDSNGEATQFMAALAPGKAYVKGYDIQTYATTYLPFDKARDTNNVTDNSLTFLLGNSVSVNHKKGTFNITSNETVNLYGSTGGTGTILGTAKIRGQEFITGTAGTVGAEYMLYLYDIAMGGSYLFSNVRSIGTSTTECADAILVAGNAVINGGNDIAVVQINESAIKTFTDINYTVRRYFSGAMSGTSLTLTAGTDELFADGSGGYAAINYQVSILSASSTAISNSYADGDCIDMTAVGNSITLAGTPTGKQAIINLTGVDGSTLEVIATISKQPTTAKTKTLANETLIVTTPGSSTLQLDKSDCYKIVSITDNALSLDITSHYIFNNGEKDDYYNRGTLVFDTDYAAPTGNVTVVFQYFNDGIGDYFSVDSYNGVIPYEDIPTYSSSLGASYNLINCLDFRSRINNAGSSFSVLSEIPIPNSAIGCSYTRYLSRNDLIVLKSDGTFHYVQGTSAVSPQAPIAPANSMTLYNVSVPAYTFTTKSVIYNLVNNKRYTMNDIGSLDTRISNLEYYSSLSLLEQTTSDLFIDDGTGNNSFKNGFIVDNFKTYDTCDLTNPDFQASLDTTAGTLRPKFTLNNVGLSLNTADSSNYTQTGTLITLPYTTESFISQFFASGTENLNPYAIYNWVGSISLTPSSDDWFDTTLAPDVVITQNVGLSPALAAQVGNTTWNGWTNTWVGTPVSSQNQTVLVGEAASNNFATESLLATLGTGALDQHITIISGTPQSIINVDYDGIAPAPSSLPAGEVGQVNIGTQTTVVNSVNNQTIGSTIVDQSSIPYIRSKNVAFSATGMKPNTQVYPFFDNTSVAAYVTQELDSDGNPILDSDGNIIPSTLITNPNGAVSGVFVIPDSSSTIQFLAGTRVFTLIDNSSNNASLADTSASATYSATGTLDTEQDTVLSTTTAQLAQQTVYQNRTVVSAVPSHQIVYIDPLAQSFLISNPGGVFLSKIDLFFASVDTNNIPVQLEIRTLINGVPTQTIVPYSQVFLNPSDITTSTDSSAVTSFVFPSPVYLQDGSEYCFVIISNSNEYNLYVSVLGQTDILTASAISTLPYAGTMFESQNSSTWVPSPGKDIKFNIWSCIFNTTVTGNVIFQNNALASFPLVIDALSTTNTSQVVNVYFENHGLTTGQFSTLGGISGVQNGIPDTELNGQQTVTVIDIDNFQFTTASTAATATGACGGANITSTGNDIIDVTNINMQNLTFPDTTLSWGLQTTPLNGSLSGLYDTIITGTNTYFDNPQIVFSEENQGATDSFFVQGLLSTTNSSISPVIDTTRTSAILVGNRINDVDTGEDGISGGSAIARYITQTVTLTTNATKLTVYLNVIRPNGADIEVYIKYLPAQSSETFDSQTYTLVPPTDYPAFNNSVPYQYTFQISDLLPFANFAIKIVMLASDESEVPVIQSLQGVATT